MSDLVLAFEKSINNRAHERSIRSIVRRPIPTAR
jgi:hypothetical protein